MQWNDLPAGLQLSSQSGWNQSLDDWKLILKQRSTSNWVAVSGEKIIGTVTSINFSNRFDWVGMMVIDPGHRRQGIGKKLMQKVIEKSHSGHLRLDASSAGKNLYENLGFKEECKLTRFKNILPIQSLSDHSKEILNIEPQDLENICTYDGKNAHYDRSSLLKDICERGQGWYYRSNNKVQGYLLARPGRMDMQIGPIVSDDALIAESLLIHALKNISYRPIILDVFMHAKWWLNILMKYEFEADRNFTRMQLGRLDEPLPTKSQFAILDPAMG